MNKRGYVANLPFQASEPELKVLFSKAGDVMSVKIVGDRQSGQPRGDCVRRDIDTMGSSESGLHAEPNGFYGEKLAGQRGDCETWRPGKITITP
jgi:hypothetical protein